MEDLTYCPKCGRTSTLDPGVTCRKTQGRWNCMGIMRLREGKTYTPPPKTGANIWLSKTDLDDLISFLYQLKFHAGHVSDAERKTALIAKLVIHRDREWPKEVENAV